MRWIRLVFISSLFTLFSCDLGKAELDSCLDVFNYPSILEFPAIGFCTEVIDGSVDDDIEVGVYSLDVSGVAGIHAQIQYDANKVQIIDVYRGDFFERSQKQIFVYDDNGKGTLDIYTFFMSNEKTTEGTGEIALIEVRLNGSGQSEFIITSQSELLDPDDIPIPIKGFGKGIINAK